MKKPMLLAILATLFTVHAAQAEGGGATPSPLIAKFVGNWKGTGTVKMQGQSAKITWKMNCVSAAGGFAAECRFAAKGVPGMESYEGSSVVGVDPATQTVHWYWVTNGGEVHDHAGPMPKGDTLEIPHKEGGRVVEAFNVTVSGKTMKWESITYDAKGGEAFVCLAEGKK
jgi:hypothetical protein